ncbi:hypothetical protein ONZ45_g1969 [Pleurotus djamor]|nr:hypothetical protein ONZ45_g1969 [Pleurotus djamor]
MTGPQSTNELRASVLDAALQLGLLRDDRFADWIFDERGIAPENNIIPESKEINHRLLGSTESFGSSGRKQDNSVNSSSTSLNEHVRKLEDAYAALATTRLVRAASRKALATAKTGGRTGPSHQVSQSEVLSFSLGEPVAGSSSTLARSATFASRSPNPLSIDSSKSNGPFITVTSTPDDDEDPELSYVSTVWGKELLQSYDIDLSSAPATPVSNSPFSRQLPLPSASPTNTSFTSSESSLHTPSHLQLFPASRERDKLPAKQQVPTDVTESTETTPVIPPTPPLVVRKATIGSPTSTTSGRSGPFVPVTPSSTILRLPSPPPTPYSAASPDSPTIPWMKADALPPVPPLSSNQAADFPVDQPINPISPRSNIFSSLSKSSSRSSSPRQTPPQSPYTSLFSRLSFKRKSKNSTTAAAAESKDASPVEPQFANKELPPIPPPPSARVLNTKALSTPDLHNAPRVVPPLSHLSIDPTESRSPRSAAVSPVSAASSRSQSRGRVSPFPVKPIRKQPPSSTSPLPPPLPHVSFDVPLTAPTGIAS